MVKMSRVFTLLSALLLIQQGQAFQAESAGDFVQGVVVGLEKTPQLPGECYKGVFGLLGSVNDLLAEVEKILKGDILAIGKAKADFDIVKQEWEANKHKCNTSGLIEHIESLKTLDGWGHLFLNYVLHKVEVDSAVEFLANCPNAWFTCGRDVGQIVRYLSGWQLN